MAASTRAGLKWTPFMSTSRSRSAGHGSARWGIVLAGGEGARMRPLIRSWLGEDRPKQYCAFVGSRSMFQHTIDRARSVVSEEHIVTIIGRGHRSFLTRSANDALPGVVVEQPRNLGTAPGVFLPTAYVLADSPEATVLLLPSDHFVHPEDRFRDHVLHAFELAEKHRDQIILAAAIPDRAEAEYGWIDPARSRGPADGPNSYGPTKVTRFREKPDVHEARALLTKGCLWNTLIVAVAARTLWTLGRECLPQMLSQFDAFRMVLRDVREGRLDPSYEASALAGIYSDLSPADFSADILQRVPERSMVLPMEGVEWCDWGHPQRVTDTLASLGRRPLFAPENAAASPAAAGETRGEPV